MSQFPDTFAARTESLPEAVLNEVANPVRLLAEKGYEIQIGMTPELADQILAMSMQPSIREYCPRDSGERFTNRSATEHWLAKKRATFLLFKKEDNDNLTLAGYGWAGTGSNSHTPEGENTFAVRIGEAGQGQGLAEPFSRLIVASSAMLYGAHNFWLETWASNGGAVHVYHKIGFETVAERPDQRSTLDGQKVPDTRIYMTLANELLPGPLGTHQPV